MKCTLSNWTGIAYKIPRTDIDKCKDMDILKQSGVYFLFGTDNTNGENVVYIELAKQISEAEKRGASTGLTEDELAFYDALADNESAREVMGDDILKQIARGLTTAIKNNISVDWSIRESVQAKMRMIIKRLLKKYGYPPDKTTKAVEVVMEQTKLMCQYEA